MQRAYVHIERGDYARALLYLLKANRYQPNDAHVLFVTARVYQQLEQNDEALQYYIQSILRVADPDVITLATQLCTKMNIITQADGFSQQMAAAGDLNYQALTKIFYSTCLTYQQLSSANASELHLQYCTFLKESYLRIIRLEPKNANNRYLLQLLIKLKSPENSVEQRDASTEKLTPTISTL